MEIVNIFAAPKPNILHSENKRKRCAPDKLQEMSLCRPFSHVFTEAHQTRPAFYLWLNKVLASDRWNYIKEVTFPLNG